MNLARHAIVAGLASALLLTEVHGASAFQIAERDVTFQNGAVTLAGTLLLPATPRRHTAVVLVHGSGPGPRTNVRPLAERFVRLGIMALIFDKRGSGKSTGSWINASLDDLADDALAAVSFLKSQPEVNPSHVGIFGISQGGWVIPHAAARQPDALAFAVIVTGGGLRPIDVEMYDYGAALDALHVSPEQRRDGLRLAERYLAYLKDGVDRTGLDQAIADARSQPWFRAVDVGRVMPTEDERPKWAWVPAYEPIADISRMRVPVLVLIGGQDRPALSAQMNERWRTSLANHPDATVVEILNADHGMTLAGSHHGAAGPQSYVPGYLNILDAWLSDHCECQ